MTHNVIFLHSFYHMLEKTLCAKKLINKSFPKQLLCLLQVIVLKLQEGFVALVGGGSPRSVISATMTDQSDS